jgi:hypothetical protein
MPSELLVRSFLVRLAFFQRAATVPSRAYVSSGAAGGEQ